MLSGTNESDSETASGGTAGLMSSSSICESSNSSTSEYLPVSDDEPWVESALIGSEAESVNATARRASSGRHTGASEHFTQRFSLVVTGGRSTQALNAEARAIARTRLVGRPRLLGLER